MATYKNDFSKNKDEILWEIHEIRHKIHKKISLDNLSEFNKNARTRFNNRKKSKQENNHITNE